MQDSSGARFLEPRSDDASSDERVRLYRALFPDLAAELDGALSQSGVSNSHATSTDDIDSWLDAGAEQLRTSTLAGVAFSEVSNPEVRERFERDFTAAREICQRAGIESPEPEAFVAAGSDLAALAARASSDATLQLVPAPHGLGIDGWRRLFADERRSETSLGLVCATEVERDFERLDRAWDRSLPTVSAARSEGFTWTLRLIPAGDSPSVLGLAFAQGPHVTLPEILMLQLMREHQGLRPIDTHSFTWLAGEISDGRLAARHVVDSKDGLIRLSVREAGQQGPHLGARPPVS